MKKFLNYLPLFVLLIVTGCSKFLSTNETPYISRSIFVRNPVLDGNIVIGGQDSLAVKTVEGGSDMYEVDTISVGDTVVFAVAFGARSNQLVAASVVSSDTTQMKVVCQINDTINKLLVSPTNIEKGDLHFASGWSMIGFPVYYYARRAGTATITLKVESDSKYSPAIVYVRQPIK